MDHTPAFSRSLRRRSIPRRTNRPLTLSIQTAGFDETIEQPSWSPFEEHTARWKATENSDKVYDFTDVGTPGFEHFERYADGQWYCLGHTQDGRPFHSLEFTLGGEEGASLEGSLILKYDDYAWRKGSTA